ncbi:Protein YceI [Streptomyces griseoloalbus]
MVTNVKGHFKEFSGTLHLDGADPSRSTASLDVVMDSIHTGNADRLRQPRSADFFTIDEFPTMTFRSTKAEALGGDDYRITGDLTILGTTRPISIDLEFNGAAKDLFGNERVGFEGKAEILRSEAGSTCNAALEEGGVLVSDKIKLNFDISAIRKADAPPHRARPLLPVREGGRCLARPGCARRPGARPGPGARPRSEASAEVAAASGARRSRRLRRTRRRSHRGRSPRRADVTAVVAAEVAVPGAVVGRVPGAGHHAAEQRAGQQARQQSAAEVAARPGAVRRAGLPVGTAAVLGVDLADRGIAPVGQPRPVGRAHRHLTLRPAGRVHRASATAGPWRGSKKHGGRRSGTGSPARRAVSEASAYRPSSTAWVTAPSGLRAAAMYVLDCSYASSALVVGAHRVVRAGLARVDEPVQLLAERRPCPRPHHHPQLLQRGRRSSS